MRLLSLLLLLKRVAPVDASEGIYLRRGGKTAKIVSAAPQVRLLTVVAVVVVLRRMKVCVLGSLVKILQTAAQGSLNVRWLVIHLYLSKRAFHSASRLATFDHLTTAPDFLVVVVVVPTQTITLLPSDQAFLTRLLEVYILIFSMRHEFSREKVQKNRSVVWLLRQRPRAAVAAVTKAEVPKELEEKIAPSADVVVVGPTEAKSSTRTTPNEMS